MWKQREFVDYPGDVWASRVQVKVQEKTASFTSEGSKVDVFYRDASPPSGKVRSTPILLLHGMRFKSQTWQDLGTLTFAAAVGHRVVAVDLPGYGNSKSVSYNGDLGQFLANFCQSVSLDRPLIVSPSMSGSFALPYLLKDAATASTRARAYVPVAPICTQEFTDQQYQACTIPTLILYGENDKDLGNSSLANLSHLSNSRVYKMADAGHACYLDRPDEWHTLFYNFLNIVEEMQ